jgi:hypothetical protein
LPESGLVGADLVRSSSGEVIVVRVTRPHMLVSFLVAAEIGVFLDGWPGGSRRVAIAAVRWRG